MKDVPTELKAEPPGAWLSVGSEGTEPVGPAPALPTPGSGAGLRGPGWGGSGQAQRAPFPGWAVCQLGLGAARGCMCAEHPDCPQRNQPAPDSSQPITYCATSTRVKQHILSCCYVPGVHTHTHTHTRVKQHILSCCCVPGVHTHTHTRTRLTSSSLPAGAVCRGHWWLHLPAAHFSSFGRHRHTLPFHGSLGVGGAKALPRPQKVGTVPHVWPSSILHPRPLALVIGSETGMEGWAAERVWGAERR